VEEEEEEEEDAIITLLPTYIIEQLKFSCRLKNIKCYFPIQVHRIPEIYPWPPRGPRTPG
jgi:hypothetical protein